VKNPDWRRSRSVSSRSHGVVCGPREFFPYSSSSRASAIATIHIRGDRGRRGVFVYERPQRHALPHTAVPPFNIRGGRGAFSSRTRIAPCAPPHHGAAIAFRRDRRSGIFLHELPQRHVLRHTAVLPIHIRGDREGAGLSVIPTARPEREAFLTIRVLARPRIAPSAEIGGAGSSCHLGDHSIIDSGRRRVMAFDVAFSHAVPRRGGCRGHGCANDTAAGALQRHRRTRRFPIPFLRASDGVFVAVTSSSRPRSPSLRSTFGSRSLSFSSVDPDRAVDSTRSGACPKRRCRS
jgi:hypothetical protein